VARAVLGGAKGASGFATRDGVATGQRMLRLEAQGRTRFAALVTDGTLGEDAMVATVLESRDLTRPWIT